MSRDEFLALLQSRLAAAGTATQRYEVEPLLSDLEVSVEGNWLRLRIVRTGPRWRDASPTSCWRMHRMSPEASWADVFGDLDVRTLDHDGHLDWINERIRRTLQGKSWAALAAGEEGHLAWDAAVQTFVEGMWLACIFSCHVVCEREVAGVLSISPARLNGDLPKAWESFGLGRLLGEAKSHHLLPEDLIIEVQRVADARKPYGHWRSAIHEESLMQRCPR